MDDSDTVDNISQLKLIVGAIALQAASVLLDVVAAELVEIVAPWSNQPTAAASSFVKLLGLDIIDGLISAGGRIANNGRHTAVVAVVRIEFLTGRRITCRKFVVHNEDADVNGTRQPAAADGAGDLIMISVGRF